MTKIFFDTNILLDVILSRDPERQAEKIISISTESEDIRIYASYLSLADMAFILRHQGTGSIKKSLAEVMKWCDILPCTDMQILAAMKSESPDFEDSLQIMCAEYKQCDLIVTRNKKHFVSHTAIPVLTPEEFCSHLG